ncbi:FixH family protein [Kaistella faecalis]|uniref:FixH family protein n=1 Tax=Kaistella faecalis TaxID=2852098 RepID=UPI001C464E87|nr:FixH family protein [Chryseobacterium faecale]UFK96880.1 FixH family protein [Chryseobacterium faecale]
MFKNFSWGHGVIVALGLFMSFILFMIFVYSNGMQNSELISDSYYEDELAYQEIIDAKNNADLLSEKPVYIQNAAGITLTIPQNVKPENSNVHFELFRTDDSNLDVKKDITLDGKNQFQIPAKVIFPGSYTLKVKWKNNKKPYQVDYDIQWK